MLIRPLSAADGSALRVASDGSTTSQVVGRAAPVKRLTDVTARRSTYRIRRFEPMHWPMTWFGVVETLEWSVESYAQYLPGGRWSS